jgi:hypothetical protein
MIIKHFNETRKRATFKQKREKKLHKARRSNKVFPAAEVPFQT